MKEFGMNLRNSQPFYVDTVENLSGKFTLFASYDTMGMIDEFIPPEHRKYMIDGTFDVVPIGESYQLLIIAIEYKNGVSALLFEIRL